MQAVTHADEALRREVQVVKPGNIASIRRENLRRLIDKHGGVSALARKLGYPNNSYVSQLAGAGKHSRTIGEKTARMIEEKLGLEQWTLDQAPGERTPFTGTDRALIASVVLAIEEELERHNRSLSPKKRAALVAEVYEHSAAKGEIDRAFLERLVSLVAA